MTVCRSSPWTIQSRSTSAAMC